MRESRKRKFSTKCGHPRTGGAEACRATMPQPRGVQWAPFWAFCYVITDIYGFTPLPPPPTLRPGDADLRIKLPPGVRRARSTPARGGGGCRVDRIIFDTTRRVPCCRRAAAGLVRIPLSPPRARLTHNGPAPRGRGNDRKSERNEPSPLPGSLPFRLCEVRAL